MNANDPRAPGTRALSGGGRGDSGPGVTAGVRCVSVVGATAAWASGRSGGTPATAAGRPRRNLCRRSYFPVGIRMPSWGGPSSLVKVHGCNSNRLTPNERSDAPERGRRRKNFVGDLSAPTAVGAADSFVNWPVRCNPARQFTW
jgi:hypothetical protein